MVLPFYSDREHDPAGTKDSVAVRQVPTAREAKFHQQSQVSLLN